MRITLKWRLKSEIGSCELDITVSTQQQWQAVVKKFHFCSIAEQLLVSIERLRSMELVSEGGISLKMLSVTHIDNFNLQ